MLCEKCMCVYILYIILYKTCVCMNAHTTAPGPWNLFLWLNGGLMVV